MSRKEPAHSAPRIGALEKSLLGVRVGEAQKLLPGLLATSLLALLSIWLSRYLGETVMGFGKSPISAVMTAILLGLLINNLLPLPGWLKPGLTFAVKKVLRLGIILLGIRVSVLSVFKLGALGLPIVLICVLSALYFTTRLNNWLKLPERLGTLIAVGTSICGVSAIISTGPAIDAEEEEVAYAVTVITVFGMIATLVYPYLTHLIFGGNPTKVGLFLGTSVHDTAQATGSALVYSEVFSQPRVLVVATVTKLVRNVFMVAVIPLMALYYARKETMGQEPDRQKASFAKLFPLFVIGFLASAAVRSIGDAGVNTGGKAFGLWDGGTWQAIYGALRQWAANFLVVALAGVGLSTRFGRLRDLGAKPFIVGLGAALLVGVASFVTISLLGALVVV
jgi:uncharacterized integral membrane protein (TIGR00698 family)